ncbi:MAG: type II toxin-antitoxin system RelE/ParE family toxin [Proteobacteria bacterium]|nr:type II toxin-antitoxin system RelE/ParE family toxin [Pseudomonadota bacterium]
MRIAWTVRAGSDLRLVRARIAQDNPDAAKATAARILDAVERLTDFPASGRQGRVPNTRELVIDGTPFVLPYRVKGEVIEILGIIHGARKWPWVFEFNSK